MLVNCQSPREVDHQRHFCQVGCLQPETYDRYLEPACCLVDAYAGKKSNDQQYYCHTQPYGGILHISYIRYPVCYYNDEQAHHQHNKLGPEKIECVTIVRRVGYSHGGAVDGEKRHEHEEGYQPPQVPVTFKKPSYPNVCHTL